MMCYDIYVVLGGEHSKKRERSNKLIELYEKETDTSTEHPHHRRTVLLTGGASWTFDVPKESTHAHKMKSFILDKASTIVPEAVIKTTTDGVDTLGDLFAAKPHIAKHVEEVRNHGTPRITVITSSFHKRRTKKLARKVYADLIETGVNIRFIGAKQHGFDWKLYWWRLKRSVFSLSTSRPKTLAQSLFKRIHETRESATKHWIIEQATLTAIFYDIGRFKLNTCDDLKAYLNSLPVYTDRHGPQMDVDGSAYKRLIELAT